MRTFLFPFRLLRLLMPLFMLALAATAEAAATRHWTILDLGSIGPFGAVANAVNNRGDVAGWSFADTQVPFHHGFLWHNGTMEDLGGAAGTEDSTVEGMNNHGLLVGNGASGFAAIWQDGNWTSLGVHGDANDANESGLVVGSFFVGPQTHCFMYRDGALQDIGTLGGFDCTARSVNDSGTIVGYSYTPGSTVLHAFMCRDGAMRDLGSLGRNSFAFSVNEAGTAVGASEDASGRVLAVIWDETGMRPLLDIAGNSAAAAINEHGDVVGSMDGGSFVLQDGTLTRLESIPEVAAAGWTRLGPHAINDRGWIVGVGARNGQGRAFLLKPQ